MREPSQLHIHNPADKGQLERSAEMFEMILQTAPDSVENYVALKDIYRQLNRAADLKRIAKGLARVYVDSNQREEAAKEYNEVLTIDPNDADAIDSLQTLGYEPVDLQSLKAESELQDLRKRCEQRLQEFQKAEEVFLKASAKARDVRRGEDEEIGSLLQAIEEKAEEELNRLVAEHERWLSEGRTEVFNQVAESLKKKADRIIQDDELNDIRRSVKQAEKLLTSTDKVFEAEWRRISEEREREFQQRSEELKRRHEVQLRSTWQELVAKAEREQSNADLALRKVKEELREFQAKLKEKEKLVRKGKTAPPDSMPEFELSESSTNSGIVVVAPNGMQGSDESPVERPAERPNPPTSRDEVGKTLGSILVQHGLVSREHLEEAIARQGNDHRPVGEILVQSGHATEEDIINALVAQAGVPYLPLGNYDIGDEVAGMIPAELARKYAIMPADRIANSLLIAMGIPLNDEQKQKVQRHVGGMKVKYFISSWSDIKAKHEQYYG
jgi:tetratricopeptide (TPR) repeat protein